MQVAEVDTPIAAVAESGEIILQHTGEAPQVVRAKMAALIDKIMSSPGVFKELPLEHSFINGMYMRRLFIPKDSLIVGAIHKNACFNIVEKGDISVLTETGSMRVKAGFTIASPPGIQKIGYAHEDTIFTNIFRTDETDPENIESLLTWASYEAMDTHAATVLEMEKG